MSVGQDPVVKSRQRRVMTGRDRQLRARSVSVRSLKEEGKGEKRKGIWKRKAVKKMKGRDVREGRCKGLSHPV
jgi:hypothetical protein